MCLKVAFIHLSQLSYNRLIGFDQVLSKMWIGFERIYFPERPPLRESSSQFYAELAVMLQGYTLLY